MMIIAAHTHMHAHIHIHVSTRLRVLARLLACLLAAEAESHEGKRKAQSLWPIFRLHHQRSRYVYDMFYKKKAISRELYEWCIDEGYADAALIAKWKKPGYTWLCCLRCIQVRASLSRVRCSCAVRALSPASRGWLS